MYAVIRDLNNPITIVSTTGYPHVSDQGRPPMELILLFMKKNRLFWGCCIKTSKYPRRVFQLRDGGLYDFKNKYAGMSCSILWGLLYGTQKVIAGGMYHDQIRKGVKIEPVTCITGDRYIVRDFEGRAVHLSVGSYYWFNDLLVYMTHLPDVGYETFKLQTYPSGINGPMVETNVNRTYLIDFVKAKLSEVRGNMKIELKPSRDKSCVHVNVDGTTLYNITLTDIFIYQGQQVRFRSLPSDISPLMEIEILRDESWVKAWLNQTQLLELRLCYGETEGSYALNADDTFISPFEPKNEPKLIADMYQYVGRQFRSANGKRYEITAMENKDFVCKGINDKHDGRSVLRRNLVLQYLKDQTKENRVLKVGDQFVYGNIRVLVGSTPFILQGEFIVAPEQTLGDLCSLMKWDIEAVAFK